MCFQFNRSSSAKGWGFFFLVDLGGIAVGSSKSVGLCLALVLWFGWPGLAAADAIAPAASR
jgi:hypothetical protein